MTEEKTNIAVSVLILEQDKFLLLKRADGSFRWGPPGGRVFEGESLIEAAIRETKEETGLTLGRLYPISVWSGNHDNTYLHAVTFVGEVEHGTVQLSEEHTSWAWVSLGELDTYNPTHQKSEFEVAQKVRCLLEK